MYLIENNSNTPWVRTRTAVGKSGKRLSKTSPIFCASRKSRIQDVVLQSLKEVGCSRWIFSALALLQTFRQATKSFPHLFLHADDVFANCQHLKRTWSWQYYIKGSRWKWSISRMSFGETWYRSKWRVWNAPSLF